MKEFPFEISNIFRLCMPTAIYQVYVTTQDTRALSKGLRAEI
jgi:hypothetical protein